MSKRYDFYDDTGAWLDSCEANQVTWMTALLTTLFGAVTVVESDAVVMLPALAFDEWLATV